MILKLAQLCIALLIICTGCHSLNERPQSTEESAAKIVNQPAFRKEEIQLKTWQDPEGNTLHFLGWVSMDFRSRGDLLIAKYGDTIANAPTYLEFYRRSQVETPSEPEEFIFLAHDYMPDMVTSIEPMENQSQTGISITRETTPGTAKQRKHFRYILQYEKNYRINPALEIWSWNIPN